MKTSKWLGPLSLMVVCALPCHAQQALIPAGSSNLTPGQYMLTNLNSGQALYVVIDQSGHLFAQDPRVLQIVVQQGQPSQPGIGQGQQQLPVQQGGGFGGLLKQGLQDLVKSRVAPQGGVPGQ